MNRNYYCKVNSQEERYEILIKLSDLGEPAIINSYAFNGEDGWYYIGFPSGESKWRLAPKNHIQNELAIEVPASELIDYVTGKKLDKDALLEEAKRRYPVGTKFKIVHCPENIRKVTSHEKHDSTFVTASDGLHINFISDLIEGEESSCISASVYFNGNWAEIVEEPKVETKFEKGKWYYYEHDENGKNKYYLKYDKHNSDKFYYIEYIKLMKNAKAIRQVSDVPFKFMYNIKEVPLSEIQQYLPDGHPDLIKEEFVLPEKWYCRFINKESFDIVVDFYKVSWGMPKNIENYYFYNNISNNYWAHDSIPKGYTEITFDQFKKYILKQEVKEGIKSTITWKIGDYVVFVENWSCSKKGDIDKIKELGTRATILYLEKEGLAGSPLHKECKLKVFSTLQEAQKFSDELLGKSKTGLRVEDLVEGEIYVNGPDNGTMWCYIIKYSKNSSKKAVGLYKTGVYSAEYCNYMGDYTEGWLLRLATPDEKKWLNTCIKQDKFIEQSELNKYDDEGNLMESEEYPEYVKLINTGGCIGEAPIINRIYKLVKDNKGNYQYEFLLDNVYKFGFDDRNGEFTKYFEPSTKEDYEAQFKKDEKFKDGDWLVYIKHCGLSPSLPIKIGDVRQMIRGSFGTLTIYGAEDLSQYFRKALPHEIPEFSDELLGKNKTSLNEGNLMESKEYPEYYECIKGDEYDFITGKIYKINNPVNLEATANFIDEHGNDNGWYGYNYKHFKPSTKSAYDAQFKKDEDYKVGDWVVVLDTPNIRKWDKGTRAIGYVFQIREDKDYYKVFIKGEGSAIDPINKYGINYKLEDVRKALPHEIPVENSVKQNPLVFEDCISPNVQLSWKTNALYHTDLGLLSPIPTPVYLDRVYTKKTPDLIDKSKVEVKIKRTKVKQIKL